MDYPNLSINKQVAQSLYHFQKDLENYAGNHDDSKYAVYILDCIQPIENDEQMIESINERFGGSTEVREQARKLSRSSKHSTEDFLENMSVNSFAESYDYPDKFDAAVIADEIKYVGQTSELDRRIKEHLAGQGTSFTQIFPPNRLSQVEWVKSREKAEKRETEIREQIHNVSDEMYKFASHNVNYLDTANSITRIGEVSGIGPVDKWRIGEAEASLGSNPTDSQIRKEIQKEVFGAPVEEIKETIQDSNTVIFAGGGK